MKYGKPTFRVFALIGFACQILLAQNSVVTSEIVSAHLFKNGWAMVTESFDVQAPGTYVLENSPVAAHGSFWLESDGVVEVRVVNRTMANTLDPSEESADLDRTMAGREVIMVLDDGNKIRGRVVNGPSGFRDLWMVDSSEGFVFVDRDSIKYMTVTKDPPQEPYRKKIEKPALAFKVKGSGPTTVRFGYLTNGLGWVPSYRLDIRESGKLVLQQKALIRNERRPFHQAALALVSGFPNIQFGHIPSLFNEGSTWHSFFQALGSPNSDRGASLRNISTQAVIFRPELAGEVPSSNLDQGSQDIHFQSIGPMSLARDQVVLVNTAVETAEYRREVVWEIPDRRLGDGRYRSMEKTEEEPSLWEEVIFKNPFGFPMTTAPAMVFSGGKIMGQTKSNWVNPGALNRLRVTKALSLEVSAKERVLDEERRTTKLFGRLYEVETVQVDLKIRNARSERVSVKVDKLFSGELAKAGGEPELTVLEEGAYGINRKNELVWHFPLASGESRSLIFTYKILVPR